MNEKIELESFTDVAIDERIESEVSKSKFETEVEEKNANKLGFFGSRFSPGDVTCPA